MQAISPFTTVFTNLQETLLQFSSNLKLLSANSFDQFGRVKKLLFGRVNMPVESAFSFAVYGYHCLAKAETTDLGNGFFLSTVMLHH